MCLETLLLFLLSLIFVFAIDDEQLARRCTTVSGYGPIRPGRLPTATITRTLKRTTITLPRTTTVFEGSYLASTTATVSRRESPKYHVAGNSTSVWAYVKKTDGVSRRELIGWTCAFRCGVSSPTLQFNANVWSRTTYRSLLPKQPP